MDGIRVLVEMEKPKSGPSLYLFLDPSLTIPTGRFPCFPRDTRSIQNQEVLLPGCYPAEITHTVGPLIRSDASPSIAMAWYPGQRSWVVMPSLVSRATTSSPLPLPSRAPTICTNDELLPVNSTYLAARSVMVGLRLAALVHAGTAARSNVRWNADVDVVPIARGSTGGTAHTTSLAVLLWQVSILHLPPCTNTHCAGASAASGSIHAESWANRAEAIARGTLC